MNRGLFEHTIPFIVALSFTRLRVYGVAYCYVEYFSGLRGLIWRSMH